MNKYIEQLKKEILPNNKRSNFLIQILEKRLINIPKDEYTETHHIIPRSWGGPDDKENLVILTAREHFIVHIIMAKNTIGEFKIKMIFAAHKMKSCSKKQNRYFNSKIYASIQKEQALIQSKKMKEFFSGEDGFERKIIISNKLKDHFLTDNGKKQSQEHSVRMKGKKQKNETIQKRSQSLKGKNLGKVHSNEQNLNASEFMKKKSIYKNINNENDKRLLSVDDDLVKNGLFVGVNKNIKRNDNFKNNLKIKQKGFSTYKNIKDPKEIKRLHYLDPLVISGNFVGISKKL